MEILARRLTNKDMHEKALACLKKYIADYPKSDRAYEAMAKHYLLRNDSIKALQFYNKVLELGDNNFRYDRAKEKVDVLNQNS